MSATWSIASSNDALCLMCSACGYEFTFADEQSLLRGTKVCNSCGSVQSYAQSSLMVKPDSAQFLDESTTCSSLWYHATTQANWHRRLRNDWRAPMAHLGTQGSAIERAFKCLAQSWQNGAGAGWADWRLYVVRINEDAALATEVVADHDAFPTTVPAAQADGSVEAMGVTRYVNRYEDRGQISLLAYPDSFTVVEERAVFSSAPTF